MHTTLIRPATLCFFLALAIRVGYILMLPGGTVFPDESRFLHAANNFATSFSLYSGKWAHDMPLMGILNGLVLMAGGGLYALRFVQAAASALLVLPVCSLARRMDESKASVWLAGLWTACYPFFVFYSGTILSETWFLLFTTSFFRTLPLLGQRHGPLLCGGFAGLAHLTRPTLLFFLPMAAVWAKIVDKASLRRILAAVAVFLVLLAPWVIRNYQIFGVFMTTNTGGGQNLWDANNPWNPDGGVPPDDTPYMSLVPDSLDELSKDTLMKRLAMDYLKEDPARTTKLLLHKFQRFWNLWPNARGYDKGVYKLAALISFGPVLLLSLAGLWVLRDRWREWGAIWLFVGYLTTLHMVAMGSIRYRLPLEPLLIACAAACAARLLHRLRERLGNEATPAA